MAGPSSTARDLGAGFLAHQIGKPSRQLALVSLRIGPVQHVGYDKAEHVIAEKFEPLIAAGAIARAFQRGNVGQRAVEQRAVGETITDAVFKGGGAALAAARLFGRWRALLRGGRAVSLRGRRFWRLFARD